MTQVLSLAQWQQGFLRALLHAVHSLVKQHSFSTTFLEKLAQLTGEPSPSTEDIATIPLPRDLTLYQVLELLSGAKASLPLLSVIAPLREDRESKLVKELESILEGLEREVGHQLRKKLSQRVYGLYVIVDPVVTGGRKAEEIAEEALQGGARIVQLRDKQRDKGESLPLAQTLNKMCATYSALFIVNDHADTALLVGAGGLHVGQEDLPVDQARRILKPHQLVGRSNNRVEEVLESVSQGADHIALGPIFPTTTKDVGRPLARVDTLRRVKEQVEVPVVAIGGINEKNVEEVVQAGADAICVSSAVGLAPEPRNAAQRIVEQMRQAGGKV